LSQVGVAGSISKKQGSNMHKFAVSGLFLIALFLLAGMTTPLANAASPTCYDRTAYTKALYAGDWISAAQNAQTTADNLDAMYQSAKPNTFDQSTDAGLRAAWELYVAQLKALQGDAAGAERARIAAVNKFQSVVPFKRDGLLTIAVEQTNGGARMLILILQGDYVGAIAYYDQLDKAFRYSGSEVLHVFALYKHGDLGQAEAAAKPIVKAGDPYNDPTVLYVLGLIAKAHGDHAEAARRFSEAAHAYDCNWNNARAPSFFAERAAILQAAGITGQPK
jgi:tetratricopeptide (TPR) repeat protein